MIVSISIELSPSARQFHSFCSADLNSQARRWNLSNVHCIPQRGGGIRFTQWINTPAGSWNVPKINRILWPEVENFSLAGYYWIICAECDTLYQNWTLSSDWKVPSFYYGDLTSPAGCWIFPRKNGVLQLDVENVSGKYYWILQPEGGSIYQLWTHSFKYKVPIFWLVQLNCLARRSISLKTNCIFSD
jgi:hypothetical protein